MFLIRRAVAAGPLSWAFPDGKLLLGESADAAVVREAAEETVVEVKRPPARRPGAPGSVARLTYIADISGSGSAQIASPREFTEVRWVTAEKPAN